MESNEAMAAKARAMFGERLKEDEYELLLQKKSIADIVTFLKTDTLYKEILKDVNEKAVHRGYLEVLLRLSLYERLHRLLRYGTSHDALFLIGASMNTEIDMILMCIRSLMNDDPEIRSQMITEMPIYMAKYMSFDLKALADVNTYGDLFNLLEETPYNAIIRKYSSTSIEEIDFVAMEYDLRNKYFEGIIERSEKIARGETLSTLKKLVRMQEELNNLSVIYRLKKYFNATSLNIKKQILPVQCLFSQREIDHLIEKATAEEVAEAIQRKYHHYIKDTNFTYIENYTDRIMRNICFSLMESSFDAPIILISYMQLSKMEIKNVINIIEGVRYSVSKDRIRTLLVY